MRHPFGRGADTPLPQRARVRPLARVVPVEARDRRREPCVDDAVPGRAEVGVKEVLRPGEPAKRRLPQVCGAPRPPEPPVELAVEPREGSAPAAPPESTARGSNGNRSSFSRNTATTCASYGTGAVTRSYNHASEYGRNVKVMWLMRRFLHGRCAGRYIRPCVRSDGGHAGWLVFDTSAAQLSLTMCSRLACGRPRDRTSLCRASPSSRRCAAAPFAGRSVPRRPACAAARRACS